MRIKLKLFATLSRFSPGQVAGMPFDLSLPEAATLQALIDYLGIPAEEAKVSFVNGLIRDSDWILQNGDEVGIFPPIGGG